MDTIDVILIGPHKLAERSEWGLSFPSPGYRARHAEAGAEAGSGVG